MALEHPEMQQLLDSESNPENQEPESLVKSLIITPERVTWSQKWTKN